MTSEWTRRIRAEVNKESTNRIIKNYHTWNADARKAAREELARRKVKKKMLPFKKRKTIRNGLVGSFGIRIPRF